jgi:hypothetical protein
MFIRRWYLLNFTPLDKNVWLAGETGSLLYFPHHPTTALIPGPNFATDPEERFIRVRHAYIILVGRRLWKDRVAGVLVNEHAV